jgi:signal transduction histidine kinase
MRWRLRFQLLVPLGLLLLAIVGISTWTAVASVRRARLQIETRVRNVAQTLSEPPQFPLSPVVLELMKRLSGADYLWMRAKGPPVSTLGEAPAVPPPDDAVVADWRTLQLGPTIQIHGQSYLCSGVRLRHPNQDDTLYILYPERLWRDTLFAAIEPSLVFGGFLGVASVLLTVGAGRRITRRIQALERRTRQIADGDFSPMPLPTTDDEIRDLVQSINDMAQRLAQFQETMQRSERLRLLGQISGGLAHQLRNGVAGARLALQLFAREYAAWAEKPGQPPPDTEPLDVALRQLTLIASNLKRFLDLGGQQLTKREPCSLTALVSEAVALLQPQCRHAGIALDWQSPESPYLLVGDGGQLEQLFLNIIGNAIEACGPGGEVSVELHCQERPGRVVVEVSDTGPGPPAELQERLFEPFVTGKPEGVGLGLAVARQTAQAHGGTLDWERRDGRTVFRIELPLEQNAG